MIDNLNVNIFEKMRFSKTYSSNLKLIISSLKYIRKYKISFILSIILSLSTMFFSNIQPLLFGNVIDSISRYDNKLLVDDITMILSLFIVTLLLTFIQNYILISLAQNIEIDVNRDLYESILSLEINEFDKIQYGKYLNIINSDVRAFSNLLTQKFSIIIDIISVIVVGIILIKINWQLALLNIIFFPISLFSFIYYGKKINKQEFILKSSLDSYLTFIQETLLSFKLIKLFNAFSINKRYFDTIMKNTYKLGFIRSLMRIKSNLISQLINSMGYISILSFGIYQIFNNTLTLGGLVAFNSYSSSFNNSLLKFSQLNIDIQEILVSIQRVNSLIDENKLIKKEIAIDKNNFVSFKNNIELNHVKFNYNNSNILLKDISFIIESNKITALVGKSGEGKTTLLNILSGLYDNYTGDIFIGKVNMKDISKEYLHEKVCVVLQENYLFSVSIKENFKMINDKITDSEIINLCKEVNIHDYIISLPEKYNTKIGANGMQLSVGQKQRLSIARALSKNADIFIFDEITSALDPENEEHIMKLIKNLSKTKTVLLISHKESTIQYADKIIVMESGRIKKAY